MRWIDIKKEMKMHKGINIVLIFFVMISVCLVSVGTLIVIQLWSAIDNLYMIAKPPHFLQMHVGELDYQKIEQFAESDNHVTDYQIMEMMNLDGSQIWVTPSEGDEFSLADCLLGLGFIVEPETYDMLLDTNNQTVHLNEGEIGIPLVILDKYNINIGDKIILSDGKFSKEFTVTVFLRDAQMNSTLCSSTRFLLNQNDWNAVHEAMGEIEYLIEFYFDDPSYASAFQTVYESAGMPHGGQAITYTLLKLVSGLPDLITVVILILVSILLMLIAALCLGFTILATLEEEVKEIGIMKAIGISFRDICEIYLNRYKLLIIIGCVLGYFASLEVNQMLISHISQAFGKPEFSIVNLLLPILVILLVYLTDMSICKKIMNYIKKISVIDTIRENINVVNGKNKTSVKPSTISFKKMPVNLWVAWKEIMVHKKSWFLMTFVMIIAECIVMISANILNTFQSSEFITYMGQQKCDMMISVVSSEGLQEKYQNVMNLLNQDNTVENIVCESYITKSALNKDKEWKNIHIACSETRCTGLQYLKGRAPENDKEIALSLLNAKEFGVETGGYLTFQKGDAEEKIQVCGIYQDVTNGGYTSKMCCSVSEEEIYQYYLMVDFANGTDIDKMVQTYISTLGTDANVKSIEAFVEQTLSGLISQFSSVVWIIHILSVFLAALITVLFMKLILIKNRAQIAIQKVTGFSVKDIRSQYLCKTLISSLFGMILGVLLVQTAGESAVSSIIGLIGMGISKITFIVNFWQIYLAYPAVLLCVVLLSTNLCTIKLKKENQLVQLIKE